MSLTVAAAFRERYVRRTCFHDWKQVWEAMREKGTRADIFFLDRVFVRTMHTAFRELRKNVPVERKWRVRFENLLHGKVHRRFAATALQQWQPSDPYRPAWMKSSLATGARSKCQTEWTTPVRR